MNISNFFINRPIFATVISIIIALVGLMSMRVLPIAQYPDVVPPEITVSATYPGASAETVSNTVASQIQESINGTEDMIYQYANSTPGAMSMHVAFNIGSDPNIDQVNVNNRVQQVLSKLPSSVQAQGVTVELRSSSILMLAALSSKVYDQNYLRTYGTLHVTDELKQIAGVGDAEVLGGADLAMRVWLDPGKLAQYDVTPAEVDSAISAQNTAVPAGNLADAPMDKPRAYTYNLVTRGQLTDPEQFRNIILRTNSDGSALRLRDVARIELGASSYNVEAKLNGETMAPIMIQQQPGANALQAAEQVKAKLADMKKDLPQGINISVPYDTTLFINASVESVVHTFIEALILVAIIVFVFLQNWRTTAISMSVVPISVIGTFSGMYMLDFSINLLSLFGMILAIGIVVDDAILVVENVERLIDEDEDLSIFDAVIEAMREVGGPVIATAFIMASVFIPVGFLGGLTGEIYRQFAITIAISVAISAVVALTFTPALTAILMKRIKKGDSQSGLQRILNTPFRVFDSIFDKITAVYLAFVRFFARLWALSILVLVLVCAAAGFIYTHAGSSLIPSSDQGLYITAINTPNGSSVDRTQKYMNKMADQVRKLPGVEYVTQVAGYDMLNGAPNTARGVLFVTLKPWSERSVKVDQLIGDTMKLGASTPGGTAMAFNMPPIIGLSTTGGLEGYLVSHNGADSNQVAEATQKVMQAAQKDPRLTQAMTTYTASVPAYRADIDYDKATAFGVSVTDINTTLADTFGGGFVNYFLYNQRNFGVYIQNEGKYRATPSDLENTYVRSSSSGERIPLSSFVTLTRTHQPSLVTRFNTYPAAKFQASPGAGYSSGDAMTALQDVTQKALGNQWSMMWSGTSYQEQAAGGAAGLAIAFGLIMVFLILAAQYESWTTPLAVVTAVPFGFLGSLLAIYLRGMSVDVYVNVGFLVVVGLAAKNAILIVEFATMQRKDNGLSIFDAAVEAAHLRFRPIIMTSLAFILGVLPLAFATGASDTNSHDIGTTVAGGMAAVAILASVFVPAYYVAIASAQEWVSNRFGKGRKDDSGKPALESGADQGHGESDGNPDKDQDSH